MTTFIRHLLTVVPELPEPVEVPPRTTVTVWDAALRHYVTYEAISGGESASVDACGDGYAVRRFVPRKGAE